MSGITGVQARERGRALIQLAAAREAADDVEGAREIYARALQALEPVTSAGDGDRDRALVGLGDAAYALRDLETARRRRQQLLDERLASLGEASAPVASAMHRLAKVHLAAADLAAAEALIRPALAIFEEALGADSVEAGHLLGDLALISRRRGDYAEARRQLERALTIYELRYGAEHVNVAGVLNNLGGVLEAMGDLQAAREAHERALAIREASAGPESAQVAQSLSNLGVIAIREGEPEAAVPALERALAIRERTLGADAPGVALTLNNLGFALNESGMPERAREVLERAVAILESDPSLADNLGNALANLGLALLMLDRFDDAAATVDRARSVTESVRGHDHPRTAAVINIQARAAAVRGELAFALGLALEAERIAREHLSLTVAGLSEREALVFSDQQREALDLALSLVATRSVDDPTLVTAAWDALVCSRGIVLEEMARRRRLTAHAELGGLADARRAAATHLSRLLLADVDSAAPPSEVEEAHRRLGASERALGEASPHIARDLDRARIGLDEIASSLPVDGCLAAFVCFDRSPVDDPAWRGRGVELQYLALVLAPDQPPVALPLGTAAIVDGLARGWRAAAGKAANDAGRSGELLRQIVWDPVSRACGNARRIFVVPDAELGLVNFGALPGSNRSYLVEEEARLAILDSERSLVVDPFEPTNGPCLLAMGAPDFDADGVIALGVDTARHVAVVGAPFPKLPESARESSVAAALWTRAGPRHTAIELSGETATEAAFRALAPGARVLHLATHGFVLDGSVASGSIHQRGVGGLVAAGERPDASGASRAEAVSGLVLAGANRPAVDGSDDGILTAEEIATLDLSGLELAVLSACESGIGEASVGEGVFGLRRAFRSAGAHTVITTLWPVEDESAREWMTAFYRARLEDRLSTTDAVRTASLEVLAARRARGASLEPASWAAFLAVGDWR